MKRSTWAKIFGWAQFGLSFISQAGQSAQSPHSWWQWLGVVGSAAIAVATHAAAGTDGSK